MCVSKEKPAAGVCHRQRVLESSFALLESRQRREHDRQPATSVVVVMPGNVMAVLANHDWGLYPTTEVIVNGLTGFT